MVAGAVTALPANAAFLMTINQVGADVVVAGSGTIDTTDLGLLGDDFSIPGSFMAPFQATATTVGSTSMTAQGWFGLVGPASFGAGGFTFADSGDGDLVGVVGDSGTTLGGELFLPEDYSSGNLLSDSSTYDNASLASLGLTRGTYVYTWGSGIDADSFTVEISGVPEASTWAMMLLGFGGLGFAAFRQARNATTIA
jgi:hypothetical protein